MGKKKERAISEQLSKKTQYPYCTCIYHQSVIKRHEEVTSSTRWPHRDPINASFLNYLLLANFFSVLQYFDYSFLSFISFLDNNNYCIAVLASPLDISVTLKCNTLLKYNIKTFKRFYWIKFKLIFIYVKREREREMVWTLTPFSSLTLPSTAVVP